MFTSISIGFQAVGNLFRSVLRAPGFWILLAEELPLDADYSSPARYVHWARDPRREPLTRALYDIVSLEVHSTLAKSKHQKNKRKEQRKRSHIQ